MSELRERLMEIVCNRDLPADIRDTVEEAVDALCLERMVNRFLCYPIPKSFNPDGGISFARETNGIAREGVWWPIGTNLFTAEEAKNLFKHITATKEKT